VPCVPVQAAGASLRVAVRQRRGRQASTESGSADDHHGQANDGADAAGNLERSSYRPLVATGQQHEDPDQHELPSNQISRGPHVTRRRAVLVFS
jgi:hypothetical protein